MNIEWLRDNVQLALADILTSGTGQLGAMEETAILKTDRFKKNSPKYQMQSGAKIRVPACILNIKQTRSFGRSFPLIDELTFSHSRWRRAIHQLNDEQRSWIRYCYGDFRYRSEQLNIVPFVWEKFMEQHKGKRITEKVKKRLQGLSFLAVQSVAGEIKGWKHLMCTDTELAEKMGIAKQTFNDAYKDYWKALLDICKTIDKESLLSVKPARKPKLA